MSLCGAKILIRAHHLLREAISLPRAKFEENCELFEEQIVFTNKHLSIFSRKLRVLCLLCFKCSSQHVRSLQYWGISDWEYQSDIPQFLLGRINSCGAFSIACERKKLMDYYFAF